MILLFFYAGCELQRVEPMPSYNAATHRGRALLRQRFNAQGKRHRWRLHEAAPIENGRAFLLWLDTYEPKRRQWQEQEAWAEILVIQ